MMNKNTALLVAGIVFAIVAIGHILRIFLALDFTVGTYMVPMSVSWVALVVSVVLCVWMFKARRN